MSIAPYHAMCMAVSATMYGTWLRLLYMVHDWDACTQSRTQKGGNTSPPPPPPPVPWCMAGMPVLCTMCMATVHGWDAGTVYHGACLGYWNCVPWCMATVHGWDTGTVYHGAWLYQGRI